MLSRRKVSIIILILTAAFGLGLLARWVQGTPHYVLYKIGAGLKDRDVDSFLTYVDTEAVLSHQVSQSLSALVKSLPPSNPLSQLVPPLGEIKLQLSPEMNKNASALIIQRLRDYLSDPTNPTLPSSLALLTLARIKTKDDYALVTLSYEKEQLRMGLRKTQGIWRVVELNPEDTQRLIKTYLLSPKS
jgi:hypothetical protein